MTRRMIKVLYLTLMLTAPSSAQAQVDFDIAEEPKKVMVKRGADAKLPCGGYAVVNYGDSISWFKGGKLISHYRIDFPLTENAQFTLYNASDKDSAPSVNVSIRTDHNDNFEAGSPRVLACIVYGCIPSPTVTWYLGNTMLRPNVYKEVNRGNFTVSSLTFVPSLLDNGKELVCKVTNNGHTLKTFEDRVTVSVGHRPICIESGFKTIGAVEGESETLVCIVESDPEPEQFIWIFADGRIIYTSSKKVSGFNNRYSSTLVWVPREDDFGPLYCRASNRFGEQKQPCTFSIINGGPPTTPECKMFWEDRTTLKVQCGKNWDGGRPQTIHLEVKAAEGTRKVSRKGYEVNMSSLDLNLNSTAELYASNSRGRSSVVHLALPEPPVFDTQSPYTDYPAKWTIVMNSFILFGMLTLSIILLCCYFESCDCDFTSIWRCFRRRPSNDGETIDEGSRCNEEIINMECLENEITPVNQNNARVGRASVTFQHETHCISQQRIPQHGQLPQKYYYV